MTSVTNFMRAVCVVVLVLLAGVADANAQGDPQRSYVAVFVPPGSDDAPTIHGYITEFYRQYDLCGHIPFVVSLLPYLSGHHTVLFEFRSAEGHSALVFKPYFTDPPVSGDLDGVSMVYETSGVETVATVVQRVCDFLNRP